MKVLYKVTVLVHVEKAVYVVLFQVFDLVFHNIFIDRWVMD